MSIITIEGIVDHGQIRLKSNVHLPDNTRVLVIVPDYEVDNHAHVYSPRLAHPEQADDFTMEVIEDPLDAQL